MDSIDSLRAGVLEEVANAADPGALDDIRVSALGRKGRITGLMKALSQMDPDARKAAGQSLNALKTEIAEAIEARRRNLLEARP